MLLKNLVTTLQSAGLAVSLTTPTLNTTTTESELVHQNSTDNHPGDALHPWCIYESNKISVSYAVVIPYDGSNDEDGWDKAGRCAYNFMWTLGNSELIAWSKMVPPVVLASPSTHLI